METKDKFEAAIKQLCAEWAIDEGDLMDAVVAAQLSIKNTLPNHPPCRDAHVGIVLLALFMNEIIRPSHGRVAADRVASMFGEELFKLTE